MNESAKVIDFFKWIREKNEKIKKKTNVSRKEKLILERMGIYFMKKYG